MVNNTEFCFKSLKMHWRTPTGKGVPLGAVWGLGSREGVVDSAFGAGLHPTHVSCARRGDIWVGFSLSFLLSKEPCMCSLVCSPFHLQETDFREGPCWVDDSRLRDCAPWPAGLPGKQCRRQSASAAPAQEAKPL